MAKTAAAKDTRLYSCPTCRQTFLHVGDQCGQCGLFCTAARVREAEAKEQAGAILAAGGQPRLAGL